MIAKDDIKSTDDDDNDRGGGQNPMQCAQQ